MPTADLNSSPAEATQRAQDLEQRMRKAAPLVDRLEVQRLVAQTKSRLVGNTEPAAVGRYQIESWLGAGAFGTVYAGFDPVADRRVAVKVLHPGRAEMADELRRAIVREARAQASLNHPNVATVLDVGHDASRPYVVMELLEGENLTQWVRSRARRWQQIVEVICAAGRGLGAAHAAGLVHCDIKPSNVVVTSEGRVKVTDFGVAAIVSHAPGAGQARGGTTAYMAPEQREHDPIDGRVDQFALCKTALELIEPSPGRRAGPKRVRQILLRGVRADPEQRFESMSALVEALEHASRPRRWTAWAGMVGIVAIAAAVSGVLATTRDTETTAGGALDCSWPASRAFPRWSPQAQAQLRDRLAATGLRFASDSFDALAPDIDTTISRWTDAFVAACPGHGAAVDCLHLQRRRLDLAITGLADVDATNIASMRRWFDPLPDPAACLDGGESRGAGATPDAVLEVEALRKQRKLARAEAAIAELLTRDRDAGESVPSEVRFEAGMVAQSLGRTDAAVEHLEAAMAAAVAHGNDALAFRAAVILTQIEAGRRGDLDAASRWERHASSLVHRLGAPPREMARYYAALGTVRRASGDTRGAAKALREADRLLTEALPSPNNATLAARRSLGIALMEIGELEEAHAVLSGALALAGRLRGKHHPDNARLLEVLAAVASLRDDEARAVALGRRAVAVLEEAWGNDHIETANARANLGVTLLHAGRPDEAVVELTRAVGGLNTAAPDSVSLGAAHHNLASAHLRTGSLDSAERAARQAIAIGERALGPQHPRLGDFWGVMAQVHGLSGDPDAARVAWRRALALYEAAGDEDKSAMARAGLEHPEQPVSR